MSKNQDKTSRYIQMMRLFHHLRKSTQKEIAESFGVTDPPSRPDGKYGPEFFNKIQEDGKTADLYAAVCNDIVQRYDNELLSGIKKRNAARKSGMIWSFQTDNKEKSVVDRLKRDVKAVYSAEHTESAAHDGVEVFVKISFIHLDKESKNDTASDN